MSASAPELRAEALDSLVIDCIQTNAGEASHQPQEELRGLLLAGAFPAAADRLAVLCPPLAASSWLQFQLKRLQFMRLAAAARGSGSGDAGAAQSTQLAEALDLARRELAPLALHAYCEAYADFKRCMLTLVTAGSSGSGGADAGPGSSSGGAEAAAAGSSPELEEFAGMIVRAVRQEAGAAAAAGGGAAAPAPPQLAQLLRYLLLLHQHQAHSGFHPYWWPETSPAVEALCARLLLPGRDALPPPALLESLDGGLAASGVREHDVQALRTSLGCDREEAVTLLRRSRGDASAAMQDALAATHLDAALLRQLCDEYAAWRGLEPLPPVGDAQAQAMEVCGDGGGGEAQHDSPKRRRRPAKAADEGAAGGSGSEEAEEGPPLELPAELSEQQLRAVMRCLERLLAAGRADAALQQLEAAEPAFLPGHPAAAFALHRCAFLEQLLAPASAGGGSAAALAVVRQHLSPLAQQHPELQPQLKAALAQLLPLSSVGGDDAAALKQRQHGLADAAAALRAALRSRCRVHEPQLLLLLRELLSLHAAHFKLQRCQDRFAPELGIPALRAPAPGATAAAAVPAAAAGPGAAAGVAAAAGGAEVPVPGVRLLSEEEDPEEGYESMEEGDSSDEEGGGGGLGGGGAGVPEQAILTVCEFTGLPRHTAIELLLANGGDPTAVLAQLFP